MESTFHPRKDLNAYDFKEIDEVALKIWYKDKCTIVWTVNNSVSSSQSQSPSPVTA